MLLRIAESGKNVIGIISLEFLATSRELTLNMGKLGRPHEERQRDYFLT